jgi:hypothetical protein
MAVVWIDRDDNEVTPLTIRVGDGLELVPLGDGVYELRLAQ